MTVSGRGRVTSAAAHLRAGCGLCCRNLVGLGPALSPDTDTRRGWVVSSSLEVDSEAPGNTVSDGHCPSLVTTLWN